MKIWIEIENVTNMDGSKPDMKNEASNVIVTLADETTIGLNVWTYDFLQTIIEKDSLTGENLSGKYQIPPDLLVESFERNLIERVIKDLMLKDELSKFITDTHS